MRAMRFEGGRPILTPADIPVPVPRAGQVLLKVRCCALCRTDLHVVDGDLSDPVLPIVPGHEIVGTVVACGPEVERFAPGERVGVPWLGWTCGRCAHCRAGRENLCAQARFTGYQIDGGFAEYCAADARFCFPIPDAYTDAQVAPLLCAGLIGYRAYRMAGQGRHLGFYGFGAAAHILIQLARHDGRSVYAFTRPGDTPAQQFATALGAVWAGDSGMPPPRPLDAAILFAPAGELVPVALGAVARGGRVVCAGIHMSDIPSFPYELLWGERRVCSVANLTRNDATRFLELAPQVPVRTEVHPYPLDKANQALDDLRNGRFQGAAVVEVA